MRRVFSILGVVMLVLIVAVGVGIGLAFYNGRKLDAQSRAFVDRAVPAITAHWDKEQLRKRASAELRQTLKPGELTGLFGIFSSRLGPLIKYERAKGQANMSYMIGSGGKVSAAYVAKGLYEKGAATIRILLVKRGGRWLIQGFHVGP